MSLNDNKKLRFGILGCGMIANVHAAAIESLAEAELAGAADFNPEAAKKFCEKYGAHAYENEMDMLSDGRIDIVCICTPSHCHAENAIRALQHGKHVVLEKPMALDSEQADRIIEACRAHDRLLTVVSQLRFSPDIQHVRQLVRKGAFGKLIFCNLSMCYWRSEEYFAQSRWHGRKEFEGGGALMNQGIHGIDLLQYIMGMPKVLKGEIRTAYHAVDVEDAASAMVEFENGAMGMIQASTCTRPGFERRMEIHGTKGYVILKENAIEKLDIPEDQIDRSREKVLDVGSHNRPDVLDSSMHARQIQNLIDAIEGRESLLIDAGEGRKAIRIIEDIYKDKRN